MPKSKQRKLPARRTANATRTRGSRAAPPAYGGAPQPTDHEHTLIGLTDPFSSQAANARYPDQGAGKSLTFQQRHAFPINSDVNGRAAFAVNPKVNFPILSVAAITGPNVTWAGTWAGIGDSSTSLVNTYGRFYRPTSMGLRICNTLSATDSSGYLVIAKGGRPPTLPSTTTFMPSNFSTWDPHPMRQGEEWHALAHPRSSNAYDLKDISTTNLDTSDGDESWDTIYVAVFGAKASAAVLYCELFINFEYTAREDAIISQLAVPQPVLDIRMQTAVNQVQANGVGSHRGGTEMVRAFIKREGKKALVKHVIPFVAKKGTALLM